MVSTKGAAATTPSTFRTVSSTASQLSIRRELPCWSTTTWGDVPRIFSRRSFCIPVMTPMTTIRAHTPTVMPPRAIQVMNERN